MASVLKFVRGVDLSGTDFEHVKFPTEIDQLQSVRWLKLNHTGIDALPSAVNRLPKLESLSLEHCKIVCITPSVKKLTSLRTFKCGFNDLSDGDIDNSLYALPDLTTLDLCNNHLTRLSEATSDTLLVLGLAHNQVTELSSSVVTQRLTDLEFLDVSYNELTLLPPQLRRLTSLKTLILNGNPLGDTSFRSVYGLEELVRLEMRGTGRTTDNVRNVGLEDLCHLRDLVASYNAFTRIPEPMLELKALQRLNLSDNQIAEVAPAIASLVELQTLNLSRNEIKELPIEVLELPRLRKFFVNSNQVQSLPACDFTAALETLHMGNNRLTALPAALFTRCRALEKLDVSDNRLKTLPRDMHSLPKLKLKAAGNPSFRLPPRPPAAVEEGDEYYNIDFGAIAARPTLRRRASRERVDGSTPRKTPPSASGTPKTLQVAKNAGDRIKAALHKQMSGEIVPPGAKKKGAEAPTLEKIVDYKAEIRPKKWADSLSRPDLDYSDLFEQDVGEPLGVSVWRIENFVPVPVPDAEVGSFYIADCYIILDSADDADLNRKHQIFFWIGGEASLDKKASAAIHAVNLRNLLGARGSTVREEQEDESREFMRLFGKLQYIKGGSETGFYEFEDEKRPTRLFVLAGISNLRASATPLDPAALHPDYLFVLDADPDVYLWRGKNVTGVKAQKGRLFAEKLSKQDEESRKTTHIHEVEQGSEPDGFWEHFEGGRPGDVDETVGTKFELNTRKTKLHEMRLGDGFLELPQVVSAGRELDHQVLKGTGVYILDDFADVWVWIGKKSSRLVRAASQRMALELQRILPRPAHFHISRVTEGNEPQVFKSKFRKWDDVVSVDHRRADIRELARRSKSQPTTKAGSPRKIFPSRPTTPAGTPKQGSPVKDMDSAAATPRQLSNSSLLSEGNATAPLGSNRGSLKEIQERRRNRKPIKADVLELFSKPTAELSEEDARVLEDQWADELENMDSFVLSGGNFVRLAEERVGHFDSSDCYVFMCTQWRQLEDASDGDDDEEEMECVAYFWQGRHAKNTGWLTFCFSTREKMEELVRHRVGCELQVVREMQQKESMRFLSLFKHELVIHRPRGSKKAAKAEAKLFRMHSWAPSAFTRTIQVPLEVSQLCSSDCFIMVVPFDAEGTNGVVYVWMGGESSQHDQRHAETIAHSEIWKAYSKQIIREGSEPQRFFWSSFGDQDKTCYEKTKSLMNSVRMFQCDNRLGYFQVKEKHIDFCQDDLEDDMMVIVHIAKTIFLWRGPLASDVLFKIAKKCAEEYKGRLGPDEAAACVLEELRKGREPPEFVRVFHGWADHLERAKDLSRPIPYLGTVLETLPPRHGAAPEAGDDKQGDAGKDEDDFV